MDVLKILPGEENAKSEGISRPYWRAFSQISQLRNVVKKLDENWNKLLDEESRRRPTRVVVLDYLDLDQGGRGTAAKDLNGVVALVGGEREKK